MDSGLTENGHQIRVWKKRKYIRLEGVTPHKKRVKIVRLDGKLRKRKLRVKIAALVLKLRIIKNIASPLKLLGKIKSAYVSMMLTFAGHISPVSDGKACGGTRILKGPVDVALANTEFENKLVFEMIKSFVGSKKM